MNIKLLLEDFCHYAKYMRAVSPNTINRYRQQVSYFVEVSKTSDISAVNKKMVHSFFLHGRVAKNWSTATYRTYYMTLIVFFRWCMEHEYMEENFVESMILPKQEKSLPKALKKQEAFKLLEVVYNYPYTHRYLRSRNHAIFSMFLYAGLRKNELLNLKLADVDIENFTIFVRKGKGNKDRIIPMSHTLAQSLDRYLTERKKQGKTCPEFFTSSNRNQGFTVSGLKRLTTRIRSASGIDFTIHKLRHTFATLMVEGGCDIYSLSKMMGHSDIKTTTIYLSATAEHLRSQVYKHPLNIRTFV
ncbi:tyrosine-type recombinase/integrase [Aquimarina hainanensis]|uniref:Tyrosine-type recombinase/integrase n=1 Tax=Aquimarina hainanensis TaxID=1578017 RepID=A0ABW5N7L8_9FLAO